MDTDDVEARSRVITDDSDTHSRRSRSLEPDRGQGQLPPSDNQHLGAGRDFRDDFGLPGTYAVHGDDQLFEAEQSRPMTMGNENPRPDPGARTVRFRRLLRGSRTGSMAFPEEGQVTISDDETWHNLPEDPNSSIVNATESLHAVLNGYYKEPDSKDRTKRITAFRDKYPGVYYEYFGDDVTSGELPKAKAKATVKSSDNRRRGCQIQ